MRTPNKEIISSSIDFAARWGFITQSLFFEFFCQMSQAQQYRYWNCLVDNGYFIRSKHHPHVLILSHKSRKLLGREIRPSRSHFYIEHDSIVARVYLSLARQGVLGEAWLEDELMRNPIEAYAILGCEQIQRLPDLVFDLKKSNTSAIRCTLEIEKVTKSRSRYAKMALAYLDMSKINVALFGCGTESTERAVRLAFSGNEFIETKRIPGTFIYENYDSKGLSSKMRFASNELTFQNFISIATENSQRERNEKSFSQYGPKKSEAA